MRKTTNRCTFWQLQRWNIQKLTTEALPLWLRIPLKNGNCSVFCGRSQTVSFFFFSCKPAPGICGHTCIHSPSSGVLDEEEDWHLFEIMTWKTPSEFHELCCHLSSPVIERCSSSFLHVTWPINCGFRLLMIFRTCFNIRDLKHSFIWQFLGPWYPLHLSKTLHFKAIQLFRYLKWLTHRSALVGRSSEHVSHCFSRYISNRWMIWSLGLFWWWFPVTFAFQLNVVTRYSTFSSLV